MVNLKTGCYDPGSHRHYKACAMGKIFPVLCEDVRIVFTDEIHRDLVLIFIDFTISDVSCSLLSFGRWFLQGIENVGCCYV